MAEYWVINGHRPECAYVLGLDDDEDEQCCGGSHCDCEPDWDDEAEEQFGEDLVLYAGWCGDWPEAADVQS